MTPDTEDDHSRKDGILLQILTFPFALLAGGCAAIGTVFVFAALFPTNKDMLLVAFVCAAALGSIIGLGLRRKLLASFRLETRVVEKEH